MAGDSGTTLHVEKKKRAGASRKRYILWILGLFIAMVAESFAREIGGTGLYQGNENAAMHFMNLDFPAKLAEWWHYFTTMYIPAHIDFIKTGLKNLFHLATGNSEFVESFTSDTLNQIMSTDFENILADAGFVGKVGTLVFALKNFGQTIFRDAKRIVGGKK